MKTGKTTIASKFPKALLLAFETGYLAIPGIMAQPINKWSEFKQVLKQLKDDKAHEQFDNIIIDTTDICYDLCEKYICNQEGVDTINQIPYGGGYAKAGKEFDEALRSIPQMGYGLVMISHSQDKTFKDENGEEYNQIVPTLANRPRLIVDRMSDIIGYAHPVQEEDGSTHTVLYMRGTPRFIAGSRFKYTPDKIEFTYDNLVKAISDAIDKQAEETGGQYITDEATQVVTEDVTYDFDYLMARFNDLVGTLMSENQSNAVKITAIVDKFLGKGKKVGDCTPEQSEQLDLIVHELEDLIKT